MDNMMMAMVAEAAGKGDMLSAEVIASPAITPEVENDAVRLSNLLSAEPAGTSSSPTSEIKTEAASSTPRTMGDAIIARLEAVGASYKNNVARTHALLDSPPGNLRLTDLLKLQVEMASISIEVELVGKGVSKAVQHIDQLSKLQ